MKLELAKVWVPLGVLMDLRLPVPPREERELKEVPLPGDRFVMYVGLGVHYGKTLLKEADLAIVRELLEGTDTPVLDEHLVVWDADDHARDRAEKRARENEKREAKGEPSLEEEAELAAINAAHARESYERFNYLREPRKGWWG